jgi:glycosyltransferase involved in cell wall biosynthesis
MSRISMPDVSVVIPSFRGGQFLRESIASVQAQSFKDWELIVVLDGCEDDLSDIEEADRRVRVIRQPQRGVSIARNVGIRHARSELIAFLDDDDRMLPSRLLAQYEAMKDEDVGLCHTQYRFIDEHGAVVGPGNSREAQYREFLRGDGVFFLSSTMVRKTIVEDVGGFNSLLRMGEDIDLVFRVARESTIRFLPEVLAEYRRHSSNVWLDNPSGGREIKLILTQHLWASEARGETEDVKAIRLGLSTVMTGRAKSAMLRAIEARSRHDYKELVRGLGQALLFSPRVTTKVVLRAARRDMAGNPPSRRRP